MLRSDRMLAFPQADGQGFGCSPAIKGLGARRPPKYARFFDHMSGKPIIRPATEGGTQAKSERGRDEWISAAEARRFCKEDSAQRVAPSYQRIPGVARGARAGATASRKRAKVAALARPRTNGRARNRPGNPDLSDLEKNKKESTCKYLPEHRIPFPQPLGEPHSLP